MRRFGALVRSRESLEMFRGRSLLVVTLLLMLVGLVVISSAAHAQREIILRQAMWMALGLMVAWALRRISYQQWLDGAPIAYGMAVTALLLADVIGRTSHGATRWLSVGPIVFQPAELAKLATVLLLARLLGDAVAGDAPLTPRRALLGAAVGVVPALLIFAQPDLGSASVVLWIVLVMVWLAGLPVRAFLMLALIGVCLAPFGWHLLKEYQRMRLVMFLHPETDPLGAGYTILQSRIAIGSGALFGKGWMAGTQGQLNFLPERHTDFIFAVIAEEWGLLGSLAILGLFLWWLARAYQVTVVIREAQGRLLVGGLLAWVGYHVIVNVGMTMGLLPVVGLPLPLMSYGGSAALMMGIAVGLIESVRLWSPRF